MRPQEDMTEQEVRADPGRVQLPRPPRPAPRNPREPGVRVGVGLAGREGAELTPLGIKNLNSFLYFFRVEGSRGRKYFTGRRFKKKKKESVLGLLGREKGSGGWAGKCE